MKKVIFICGPNGVGKTTVGFLLKSKLSKSAFVDSDWCRCINHFEFTDEMIDLNKKNILALLTNYLSCNSIDYVIFTYSLHGPRKEIFRYILNCISCFEYEFVPFTLTCELNENIRRMIIDQRDDERIERAINNQSQLIYSDLNYTVIDTTHISASEVANKILKIIQP